MNRLSVKLRISLGLACLLASVLLVAVSLGIVPDRSAAVLNGRVALCETIAIQGSALVSRGDLGRFGAALEAIVKRNPDVLSAAVRLSNGKVVASAGAQEADAGSAEPGSSISVPLWSGEEKWGAVEVRFKPIGRSGVLGFLHSPVVRLVAFVSAACFLLFLLYLRKVLDHLDPSKVVPQRVRAALDTLAEGLILMDRRERIVLANQAFARKLGVSPESLQGRRASTLPWIRGDEESPAGKLPWVQVLEGKEPSPGAMVNLPNGSSGPRTFLVNAAPVLAENGGMRGALASFEDVTLLQEKERELKKSKEVAEAASRAKGDFLARMSHEIRTPLNAVLGFTDVLRRGLEESEATRREYLDTIHASGKHLLDLINDVLDLSKIESGRLEIEKIPCSPLQVASEVAAVLRARAEQKGITLGLRLSGKVPETVHTDPGRLRQVLMNLAGNAIKFTERGGVEIVARLAGTADRPELAFDVIDTGIGMAPESLDKIFDPFTQADSTITRRFGGTGLGLSISKQFVEALGGSLTVQSELGKGTVFTATVDPGSLEGVELLDAIEESIPDKRQEPQSSEVLHLPRSRILLVEDGESNRKLVTLVLRRSGAEVETAENGQIGVEIAGRGGFDLILMDMQMPVMDGYEATARLREMGSKVPIIALTAHAMKGEEEKCLAAGCSGFITKPIDLDLLMSTIAEELGKAGVRPESVGERPPAGIPAVKNEETVEAAVPVEVRSSLDLRDPEFYEIVVEFVERLRGKLDLMRRAWSERNLVELARLAHWLKGSGGTAGLHALTEPARELELLAKGGQEEDVGPALERVCRLAERIVLPEPEIHRAGG